MKIIIGLILFALVVAGVYFFERKCQRGREEN